MTIDATADPASLFALDGARATPANARDASAPAGRSATGPFVVEWQSLAQLEAIAKEWRDLASRTLEPNVFYTPAVALSAAAAFGREVGAVLVWSQNSPRRLLGFFPARTEARRYGLKLPILVGWTHAYAPLGVPLVDRREAEAVIAAWLAHIGSDPALPDLVLLPFLPDEGPFATALAAVLRRLQMPAADFNRHRRALLAPPGDRMSYVEESLAPRKLRELRRIGRRLAETGAVLFATAAEPASVAAAVEDFFILEAAGWKGRAGTAAANHDHTRRFVRVAMAALAREGNVEVDRLLLDGRAIAATITLRDGGGVWFWKIAYDEKLARFSPGVMLTAALTERLAEDETIGQADSCATADHPMIDHIWRERLALCDRLLAVGPQGKFEPARRLEALRRVALTGAKNIRDRLRRR